MRGKKEIVIVHFQALELYPPVMNMLTFLDEEFVGKITVFSFKTEKVVQEFLGENLEQKRFPSIENRTKLYRAFSFLRFVLRVLNYLLKSKPSHVFYYESHSALPVYLYFKFTRRRRSRLFIHYHEYNTPDQYQSNMFFVRLSHRLEKMNLWKKAEWISHTNQSRLRLFQKDYPSLSQLKVIPNYPPRDWTSRAKKAIIVKSPVKFVYVGSIGLTNFYLQSFVDWLLLQKGRAELTIYTQNFTLEAKTYLESIDSKYLRVVYGGVWYYDFPDVIREYDVGLILYKGFSKNYVYNETNKLFEYLSLGLDVWFAEETKAVLRYQTSDTFPRIIPVNYNELGDDSISMYTSREGKRYHAIEYCFENAFFELLNVLHNVES